MDHLTVLRDFIFIFPAFSCQGRFCFLLWLVLRCSTLSVFYACSFIENPASFLNPASGRLWKCWLQLYCLLIAFFYHSFRCPYRELSRFMENRLVLSQFTWSKFGISLCTREKWHFLVQTYITYDIRPLLLLRIAKRKASKNTKRDDCHCHAKLLITFENNRRHNQNHGSRRIKDSFLISRRIILENHGARRLIKSRFKRKKTSHFTFHKKKNCWFSHDVTKIQTSKLLILLIFYFHDV